MIKSPDRLIYSDEGKLDSKWAYQLEANKTFILPRVVRSFEAWVTVATDDGPTPMLIGCCYGDILTICKGYQWDGLTCWPDTAANMIGGLPHDFGYQLGGCPNSPFSRQEIDLWLKHLILPRAPIEARVTYAGVRAMGWAFYGKKSNIKIKLL